MATKDEILQEGQAVKSKHDRRLLYLILAIMCMCMFLMVFASLKVYSAVKDTADAGADLAAQVRSACADPSIDVPPEIDCNKADKVIEEAPTSVKGDKGDQGEPGPPPSDAQVALAVASYCAGGACDGENATQAQVSAAVAQYCNNRGQCRGPIGTKGDTGDTGATGEQGPPPSDAQVASAVAAYCSTRNECSGPRGERGEAGTPGDVVTGGECSFDGPGSITITIKTATGPTTFQCSGNGPIGGGGVGQGNDG